MINAVSGEEDFRPRSFNDFIKYVNKQWLSNQSDYIKENNIKPTVIIPFPDPQKFAELHGLDQFLKTDSKQIDMESPGAYSSIKVLEIENKEYVGKFIMTDDMIEERAYSIEFDSDTSREQYKNKIISKQIRSLAVEMAYLQYFKSKNASQENNPVIEIFGANFDYKDLQKSFIALEKGKEDLQKYFFKIVRKHGHLFYRPRYNRDKAVKISLQLAKGLEFVHSQNIAHLDIKPENFIVFEDGRIKVI